MGVGGGGGRDHRYLTYYFSLFCYFGQKVDKLVPTEDHAWVVIVFPLEMILLYVNMTSGGRVDCLAWTHLNTGEAVFH